MLVRYLRQDFLAASELRVGELCYPPCDRDVVPQFPRPPPPVMAIGPPITVKSLRALKNSVIGNPSAKASLAQDEAFVHVSVLNPFKLRLSRNINHISSLTPVLSVVSTNQECMLNANRGHPWRLFGSRPHTLSLPLPTVSEPRSFPHTNHINLG